MVNPIASNDIGEDGYAHLELSIAHWQLAIVGKFLRWIAARASHFDPATKDLEAFFIYQKGKRVQGYGDTGIGDIVQRVADRAGIGRKIGNHTLRRTGAKLAKRAGVDIDIIKEGLGHERREQTYRYLQLTVEEQSKGEELVTSYLQQIEEQMENGTVEAPEVRINAGAPR